MKRMLALLTALLLLAAVPAMAEEQVLPSDDVTLTFFAGNGDVKFNEVVETLIAKFEEEYPMIDADLLVLLRGPQEPGRRRRVPGHHGSP